MTMEIIYTYSVSRYLIVGSALVSLKITLIALDHRELSKDPF